MTALVEKLLAERGGTIDVAFCPERIAEGKALEELFALPQIVSAPHAPRARSGRPRCSAADRQDRA